MSKTKLSSMYACMQMKTFHCVMTISMGAVRDACIELFSFCVALLIGYQMYQAAI